MNSAEDVPPNGDVNLHDDEDRNANVSDTNHGAIPKKSSMSKKASTSKTIKLNNNIENLSTLNTPNNCMSVNYFLNESPSSSRRSHAECCKFDHGVDTEPESDSDADAMSNADTEPLSEDGCIYTYKGDHHADLPSSFFDIPPDIDVPLPPPQEPANEENHRDVSSPEMDYLEMDFDPSNNGDADSVSEIDDIHMEEEVNQQVEVNNCENHEVVADTNSDNVEIHEQPVEVSIQNTEASTSTSERWTENDAAHTTKAGGDLVEEKPMPWACTLLQRTMSISLRVAKRVHCSSGEFASSPSECQDLSPSWPNCVPVVPETDRLIEPAMVWQPAEASIKQITRLGPSSCGASAVLNVLNALRFPLPNLGKLCECITVRQRENEAPLTRYLLSRSNAGATHKDLIEGLHKLSNGTIYARFFHMYPERVVNLYTWLAFWISNGAVPIATLNIQRCVGTVPDAWHHQMIYGVDANGIYLTNPLEHVTDSLLWPQLCSESVLLIRRRDVLSRWNFNTDMPELMRINDVRWQRLNVVGQVANMVNENIRELRPGYTNTSYIRIPASYSSGITLAVNVNSPACALLKQCPELPLLQVQIIDDEKSHSNS